MKRQWLYLIAVACLGFALMGHSGRTDGQNVGNQSKFPDFDTVVKGAKEHDGLFKLYHKDDHLFAELKPYHFNTPYLIPMSIARGHAGGWTVGGDTLNFEEQWVVLFKRVNDRVFVIRRNVRFNAKPGAAVAKAVETTYTDSVLLSLPIRSVHPVRQSVLINLNDVFMTDFARLNRGYFDVNRSTWHKVKAFQKNIELQVAATYAGYSGDDDVIDERSTTVVIHYGICQMPDSGYTPRLADDRVGHFLSVIKDYTSDTRETPFYRYVNRWRLERSDGSAWKEGGKLVQPKKKIVFWVEKSVPEEYRAYVKEGILEWNKAFEKVGFRDAIEVRQQQDEDFDPEDVNYNTFRWLTNDRGFAKGPSRANPLTGEIFDADIIFDASMVRYYRRAAAVYSGGAMADEVSPIRAQQRPLETLHEGAAVLGGWDERPKAKLDPFTRDRFRAINNGVCECGPCMSRELNLLAMALAVRAADKKDDKKDDNKAVAGPGAGILPEELIGQGIKEVVMHEVGHVLGLRHNFKASTMLDNKDLHNTEITKKRGLVGSVMDYAPINLAPKGVKQGEYFASTLGPYDYWAIEYAYKPIGGGTEGELPELKKIASRCASPGLSYATDEDVFTSSDPYVNRWDLGSDPMKFAQDRILLAEELLPKLADKGAQSGEGYQTVREGFLILLQEYGNGAYLISKFVGGVSMNRDHNGDSNGRDPLVVVPPEKQREALKFLQEHILTDRPFNFSPKLLRRLATDRWLHWGSSAPLYQSVEFPVQDRILRIQQVVLQHGLSPAVLRRIQNNALNQDADSKVKPLQLDEVFRGFTDTIWADPINGKKQVELSVVRRNLQRDYVKRLTQIVLGQGYAGSVPPDAKSLARSHLKQIDARVKNLLALQGKVSIDDSSVAHLEETHERITKALSASMTVND